MPTKKEPKEKKDPNMPVKPKKPKTGYFRWYYTGGKDALKLKHPKLSVTQLAVEGGKEWKKIKARGEDAKYVPTKKEEQEYEEKMKIFENQMKAYNAKNK